MNGRARCAAGLATAAAVALLAAAPAWAAPSTEVVQGRVLRLVSVADWSAASSLLPGQIVQWDVTVSAEAADPGVVTVGVSADGEAELVVEVLGCDTEWDESGCSEGETTVRSAWAIRRDGVEVPLLEMADTDVAYLRMVVALAADDDGSTQMRVHARGAGESAMIGPDGGLATTGMSPLAPWVVGTGLALVGGGAALSAVRRRRASAEIGEDP